MQTKRNYLLPYLLVAALTTLLLCWVGSHGAGQVMPPPCGGPCFNPIPCFVVDCSDCCATRCSGANYDACLGYCDLNCLGGEGPGGGR